MCSTVVNPFPVGAMDSSWTRVRQLVANRVLHRHLQDLEEQQVAAEMTQRQHVRQEMECERLARRSRASSVQMGSSGKTGAS